MRICISIVTHNQSELVLELLKSLNKFVYCVENEVEVIITENNFVLEKYECKFPLKFKMNLHPRGFGTNHNSVFEEATPDLFLVVNPDIKFIEHFDLDLFLAKMNESKTDISSPIIQNNFGQIDDYKRANLTFTNFIKRNLFRMKDSSFDWFAGMFLIIRGTSFRELGGFDERFFMFVEDCDFCVRASKYGFRIADTLDIAVKHNAQRASRRSFRFFIWHIKSLIKYWLKLALTKT